VTINKLVASYKCHKIVSCKRHDMAMKLKVQSQTLWLGQNFSSIATDDPLYDVKPHFVIACVITSGIATCYQMPHWWVVWI